MKENLVEEKVLNKPEVVILEKNNRAKKVMLIILKLLVLFVMPILVAILDHFVF